MKRRLLIIAVFLLLGAVVNVAVAWGFGEWPGRAVGGAVPSRLPSDAGWPRAVPPDWPQPTSWTTAWGVGGTLATFFVSDQRGFYSQLIGQWGWPLRCLESEVHSSRQQIGGPTTPGALRRLKPIAPANGFLLMRPIWPGFALNTLLYAAILWLLIASPFVLRRFLRVRGGLCPKCAYPMGESAVCTECGRALPSST